MIQISTIVPTYNRPRELRLCLQGFAVQTAPRESFEVIVIDDGSDEDMGPLVAEFSPAINLVFRRTANAGPSAARNLAIDLASGPFLLLYDDDLRPAPEIISTCSEFHSRHPEERQLALLWFRPDEAIASDTLVQALFPRMYPFPLDPASWGCFWSGSSTCKKSLFRFAGFNENFRALEDFELEVRLKDCIDLEVTFEQRPMGSYTRPLSLAQFLSRSFRFGYFGYHLARAHPKVWLRHDEAYPDCDLLKPDEFRSTIATLNSLLARQPGAQSPLFRILTGLFSRVEAHARADGWKAALTGRGPALPEWIIGS